MSAASKPARGADFTTRVRRLCPDRRDPEAFHVEKDAIERELRQLARAWGPRP